MAGKLDQEPRVRPGKAIRGSRSRACYSAAMLVRTYALTKSEEIAIARCIGSTAAAFLGLVFVQSAPAQERAQKISADEGGFQGPIQSDAFGFSAANLGPLNGEDSVLDLAVGELFADEGKGALWVLFLGFLLSSDEFTFLSIWTRAKPQGRVTHDKIRVSGHLR